MLPERWLLRWNTSHAALMLIASVLTWFFQQPAILTFVAVCSFSAYIFAGLPLLANRFRHLGRANIVTIARLSAALALLHAFPLVPLETANVLVSLIFLMILCLDGLDGYLARRYDESSLFGQYLDMESDALIVLILTVLLWLYQDIPALIILPGIMRYLYVFLLKLTVPDPQLEPKRRYASVIAVIFNLALILNLLSGATAARYLLAITSILLLLSFARSWIFQISFRTRRLD